MTPPDLLKRLIEKGGAIVSSNECSDMEIADAAATGRWAVDENGFGFVLRYREWLDSLNALKETLRRLDHRVHTGYDFNADPDSVTLEVGKALA